MVDGADEVEVTLKDGRALPAEVIGVDREVDLAVVKVDGEDLVILSATDVMGVLV